MANVRVKGRFLPDVFKARSGYIEPKFSQPASSHGRYCAIRHATIAPFYTNGSPGKGVYALHSPLKNLQNPLCKTFFALW